MTDTIRFSQYQSLIVTSSDVHVANGAAEALTGSLNLTGSPAGAFTVFIAPITFTSPEVTGLTWITNSTTQTVTIASATTGGSTVNVAASATALVFCKGANVTAISTGGSGGGSNFTTPIIDTSTSATFTVGPGAGTGAAQGSNGGLSAGQIYIETGASPAANSILGTWTFAVPVPVGSTQNGPTVMLTAGDANGATVLVTNTLWVTPTQSGGNYTGFQVHVGSALTAGGYAFTVNYINLFR